MTKIGAAWERIASEQEKFVARCEKGGFAAFRLKRGSSVRYDVVKSDSIMHPYTGVVQLHGIFEENTSSYDRSCSPTVEAALANNNWWGIEDLTDWTITYQVTGDKLSFDRASQTFLNNGGYALANISPAGTSADWSTILVTELGSLSAPSPKHHKTTR